MIAIHDSARRLITDDEVDVMLAEKIMGWERWQNDWYLPWDTSIQARRFQAIYGWSPTHNGGSALQVWRRCLEKALEMGYELTMHVDAEGRVHINGNHPVAKRLLVVDKSMNHAICRFALRIFGIDEA